MEACEVVRLFVNKALASAELKIHLDKAKILVVDGNSVDQTVETSKNLGVKIVFQDGCGKGDAFAKAIERIAPDTDNAIIIDADFTYPAEYIPKMIKTLEKNPGIGMICGNRFTEHLDSRSLHNVFYFGSRLIAFTHNFLNGVPLTDPLTGLRVVRGDS
jgi:dolichol-phosphate mannosyltransferase